MTNNLAERLQEVLGRYPTLAMGGFEDPRRSETLVEDRERLRADLETIHLVHAWLSRFPKVSKFNPCDSYGLKHYAEEALEHYVAEGQLIAAAIVADFDVKRIPDRPRHVLLNISKRATATPTTGRSCDS